MKSDEHLLNLNFLWDPSSGQSHVKKQLVRLERHLSVSDRLTFFKVEIFS